MIWDLTYLKVYLKRFFRFFNIFTHCTFKEHVYLHIQVKDAEFNPEIHFFVNKLF